MLAGVWVIYMSSSEEYLDNLLKAALEQERINELINDRKDKGI